jgi:hypothetical protein
MDERTNPDEQPLPINPEAEPRTAEDEVEEASEDSFPASDPPSFTGTTTE